MATLIFEHVLIARYQIPKDVIPVIVSTLPKYKGSGNMTKRIFWGGEVGRRVRRDRRSLSIHDQSNVVLSGCKGGHQGRKRDKSSGIVDRKKMRIESKM